MGLKIKQTSSLVLLLLACALVPSSSATHVSKPVLVEPNAEYALGEKIMLYGWVSYNELPAPGVLLRFNVYADGTVVSDRYLPSDSSGNFTFEFETDGLASGTYDIEITSMCLEVHRQICTHQSKVISVSIVDTEQIPHWIKNNARWWADGQIGDSDFVQGLQYLISTGIIKTPLAQQTDANTVQVIPYWIRTSAGWWADGLVSDSDFVSAIQFLIAHGIIIV